MKKFAIGCGIVALVVIGLLILGGVIIGQWVGGQMNDIEHIERFTEAMTDEYGAPDEFIPPDLGEYDVERVALYVELREMLTANSAPLADRYNEMIDPGDKKKGGLRGFIQTSRLSLTLLRDSLGQIGYADSLLVAKGMSRGEYLHYNVLALYSVMDIDVETLLEPLTNLDGDDTRREVFGDLAEETEDEARRWLRAHTANALRIAERMTETESGAQAWVAYLTDQQSKAKDARHYIPMSDPLPASLAAAFAQYSSQLVASRPETVGDWMAEMPLILEVEQDENNSGIQFKMN